MPYKKYFVLITIVLSVSLLGVMSLFQLAREQKIKKQLDIVQYVIYDDVREEQIEKLKASDEIDFLTVMKFGNSFEFKNKMIRPVYFEKDTKSIKTKTIVEGNYLEKFNEIVVDKPMLKLFPNSAKVEIL